MTWDLRLGDCFDPLAGLASLADKSVDHVITDPPYEAEAHARGRTIKVAESVYEKSGAPYGSGICVPPLDFAPMDDARRVAVAAELARVTRRWLVVFCQIEAAHKWIDALEDGGAIYKRTGIWHKPNGQPQLTGDRPGRGFETIVIAHTPCRGRSRWNGGGRIAVWTHGTVLAERVHTTQKPLPLMSALVADFTDRGETILDPFAGSGTTGVAAVKAGRSFIGWELDPKYHATALRRLEDTREQAALFEGRVAGHEQLALGGGR